MAGVIAKDDERIAARAMTQMYDGRMIAPSPCLHVKRRTRSVIADATLVLHYATNASFGTNAPRSWGHRSDFSISSLVSQ
jgi:hypothetical protein